MAQRPVKKLPKAMRDNIMIVRAFNREMALIERRYLLGTYSVPKYYAEMHKLIERTRRKLTI